MKHLCYSFLLIAFLILSLSSCTKDMSNEKDTGEILDKTFYLFSRSTGGTDGYYTDTTSGTPQPVRYLKLYTDHYFKSQDVKVNKENGEYVLDLKDSIFSSIDTGEDSVVIINAFKPYEYKYVVPGYLQSETNITIDEVTNISGSGSSTIYSTGPSSTTTWYLSSNQNFFESLTHRASEQLLIKIL